MSRISIGRLQILLRIGIFVGVSLSIILVCSVWHTAFDKKKGLSKTTHQAPTGSTKSPRPDPDLLLGNPTSSWTRQESFTWKPPEPPSDDANLPANTQSAAPTDQRTSPYLTVPIGQTTAKSKVELTVEEGTVSQKTQKTQKDPSVSSPKFILLMSYMRSGSSLSAELLSQSEDTFYMFEPFWGIYGARHRRSQTVCSQAGRHTCTAAVGNDESVQGTFFILKDLFNCHFKNLPIGVLESFTMFYPNTAYNASLACFPSRESYQGSFIYRRVLQTKLSPKCLELVEQMCLRTTIRLIKTVRLPVSFSETFFKLMPNLKIVHLVRDPRAIVHSRLAINYLSESTAEAPVKLLCDSMDDDLNETGRISQIYKQHIILLFYDCLVMNPYQIARSLYHFLDLNYNSKTEAWIAYRMNSSSLVNQEFVKSGNSRELASRWRSKISFPLVQLTDKTCENVYEKLGLRKFPRASSLRNTQVSNFIDPSQCQDDAGLDEWIQVNKNFTVKGGK